MFVLAALFNALLLPARRISTVPTPMREGLSRVLKDRRFCTYVLTLTGYYMLAVQVMLMLPIMVNQVAGSASAVKWMYAIEATLSLTLLYPIARWSEKRFRLHHRLMAGLLLMTLSLLPIGLTDSLQQLFVLISLFYIGSIIAEPARETLSAELASARARGSYLGFSRLGLGAGRRARLHRRRLDVRRRPRAGSARASRLMLGSVGMATLLALWWQFQPRTAAPAMLSGG